MANTSNYLIAKLARHLFPSYLIPSSIAYNKPKPTIGLTLNIPNISGSYVEVASGVGYSRWPNASGTNVWSEMNSQGFGYNMIPFTFGPATSDWGTVSGIIICDSGVPGQNNSNMLYCGQLAHPKDIKINETFILAPSSIKISIQ
jgi:hypothetical protein